jgi:hypothetical protein
MEIQSAMAGPDKKDDKNDKKWFVYLSDHHEGPFTVSEMQRKLERGQISSASYIWAEGMVDWSLMQETPPFEALVRRISAKESLRDNREEPSLVTIEAPKKTEPTQTVTPPARNTYSDVRLDSERPLPRKRSARWPWISLLFLVLILGVGLITVLSSPELQQSMSPVLIPLSKKVPSLAKWISPIPWLTDVPPEEFENLKTAASASVERTGSSVAFAMSMDDPSHPFFYIASNLPDGAAFDVNVRGVAESLLGQTDVNVSLNTKIQKNLAKTTPFKLADGSALPAGQYVVTVSESTDSPNKASSSKTLFLGGVKDASYETSLKDFHDKLKTKASQEIVELKAFTDELGTHIDQTIANFNATKKKKKAPLWKTFDTEWTTYDSSLNDKYKAWTPDALKSQYFYGMTLYAQAQQTAMAAQKLHALQNDFLNGHGDVKALEIQVAEATSVAQSSVITLKAKIDQAEKLPASPNGMPQREGL